MSGEIVRHKGPRAMSVEEAKENLLVWGESAQAAHEAALENARRTAKRAAPFAAIAAGLMGLTSVAKIVGGSRKRSRREGRDQREEHGQAGPSLMSFLPLVMAGAKLAPVIMDAIRASKRRG